VSAAASSLAALPHDRRPLPAVLFELLAFSAAIAAASLAFVAGWLSVDAAVVLTVALLAVLIVLSWINLGQGRHPVFLFLCTLALFQGGRLIAFCFGQLPDPLAIGLMREFPFAVSREVSGVVLLCLSLSAVCVYLPCRWSYCYVPPPSTKTVSRYLPYLYFAYFATLPFQLYKNYLYFTYIQQHGGYVVFFSDYSGLVGAVPLVVRLMALFPLPLLVLIFVFEQRKKLLAFVVALYFCGSIVLLLTGTRMSVFSLVLTLWYVSRVKSGKPSNLWRMVLLVVVLAIIANLIAVARESDELKGATVLNPVNFVGTQGISLNVTEVAVMQSEKFRPYVLSYLLHELQIEFVQADVSNYFRGRQFGYDVSVFLNPSLFSQGFATSGTYLGEAYVIAGILGVAAISLLIGYGLRALYACGRSPWLLVLAAFLMPQALLLPRGFLLGWVSSLLRAGLLLLPILVGWVIYRFFATSLRPSQPALAH
jgi:hypothetical protein